MTRRRWHVLEAYRPRYAKVAELGRPGQGIIQAAGELKVVEHIPGIGMTDFYGGSR